MLRWGVPTICPPVRALLQCVTVQMQRGHEPIYGKPSFTVDRRIEIARKHGKHQVALTPSGHDACE